MPETAKGDSLGLTLEDWILAVLAYAEGELRGKTRLQKTLFIIDRLEEKYNVDIVPAKFVPYDYGPFSVEVEEALRTLRSKGLIDMSYRDVGLEEPLTVIRASNEALERGKRVLERLRKTEIWEDIDNRIYFGVNTPLMELLWYVYEIWPEYTERSLLRHRLRLWRKRKLKRNLFPRNYREH